MWAAPHTHSQESSYRASVRRQQSPRDRDRGPPLPSESEGQSWGARSLLGVSPRSRGFDPATLGPPPLSVESHDLDHHLAPVSGCWRVVMVGPQCAGSAEFLLLGVGWGLGPEPYVCHCTPEILVTHSLLRGPSNEHGVSQNLLCRV